MVPEQEAKSISHETTFATDIDDPEALRAWLLELSEQVGCRLRRHGLKGRTVHLKVRFADFHTITRAQTLPEPTNVTQEIWETAAQMFAERLPSTAIARSVAGRRNERLRRIRHDCSGACFPKRSIERQSRLDEVADQIKEKFGQSSLQRALGMLHNVEHGKGPPGRDDNQYGK